MKPDTFLAYHSIFTREELAAALEGRRPATLDAHLARWLRQGRIERVKNGLYVRRDPENFAARAPCPTLSPSLPVWRPMQRSRITPLWRPTDVHRVFLTG